jgi:hypothetical protein
MTRNDLIRRAVNVMTQDETGAELVKIFRITCPGLREQNLARESNDLKSDVKETIKAVRACLRSLSEELNAIDN